MNLLKLGCGAAVAYPGRVRGTIEGEARIEGGARDLVEEGSVEGSGEGLGELLPRKSLKLRSRNRAIWCIV